MNQHAVTLEEFSSKAATFHANSMQLRYPIPYDVENFTTVVTIGYKMLQEGEYPTIQRLKEEMKKDSAVTGKKVKQSEIKKIFRGEEMGVGPCWQWLNHCWDYIHKLMPTQWLDYDRKVYNSERTGKARTERGLQHWHLDFMQLLLTIEYL